MTTFDTAELDDFNAFLKDVDRFVDDARARRGTTAAPRTAYERELDDFNAERARTDEFVRAAAARR
jgi:hypothetical protein